MRLEGKRVLITGASRGIGEALADKFTEAGATVALVARTKDALESGRTSRRHSASRRIFRTRHRCESDRTGRGRSRADRRAGEQRRQWASQGFTDAPEEALRMTTELDYLAPAELCRQAIPRMLSAAAATSSMCPRLPESACIPDSSRTRRPRRRCPISPRVCAPITADCRSAPRSSSLVRYRQTCSQAPMTTHRLRRHSSGSTVCSYPRRCPARRWPPRSSGLSRGADDTSGFPDVRRLPRCSSKHQGESPNWLCWACHPERNERARRDSNP